MQRNHDQPLLSEPSILPWSQHRPLFSPRWVAESTGKYISKAEGRPQTRAYRSILQGQGDTARLEKQWDWCIVVDDLTDESGWTYGNGFQEIRNQRHAMRRVPRRFDLVRKRKWITRTAAEALKQQKKRNATHVRILDPVELKLWRIEAKAKMESAHAAVWELIDELDSSIKIKDLYTALLDPVALNRVSVVHLAEMQRDQKAALLLYQGLTLEEKEVWEVESGGLKDKPDVKRDPSKVQRVFSFSTSMRREEGDIGAFFTNTMQKALAAGRAAGDWTEQVTAKAVVGTIAMGKAAGNLTFRGLSAIPGLGRDGDEKNGVEVADRAEGARSVGARVDQAEGARLGQVTQPGSPLATVNEEEACSHEPHIGIFLEPDVQEVKAKEAPQSPQPKSKGSSLWRKVNESIPRKKEEAAADNVGVESVVTHPRGTDISQVFSRMGRWGLNLVHRPLPTEASRPHLPQGIMKLSLPELKCAYRHALAIYGDVEHYVDGLPHQTLGEGITKGTGVLEEDVLLAVWKASPFEPAHYVAVDRKMQKIVICIRGTMETSDILTDLVSRPELHTFAPGLSGYVHQGLMKSAKYVLASIYPALEEALAENPNLPILVTGHSMGGGISGLLALLLRLDPRLHHRAKERVRAVCLASAAAVDRQLTWHLRGFCTSIILDSDLVPRVDVFSVAHFVQEVAKASPLKQALLSLNRLCSSKTKGEDDKSVKLKMLPLFAPGLCLWVLPGTICLKTGGASSQVQKARSSQAGGKDPEPEIEFESPTELRQSGFSMMSGKSSGLMDILMQELHVPPNPSSSKAKVVQQSSKVTEAKIPPPPFELRMIESHHLGKILFFQKACTDHLPTSYLTAMRSLVQQQEDLIEAQQSLMRVRTNVHEGKRDSSEASPPLNRNFKSSRF